MGLLEDIIKGMTQGQGGMQGQQQQQQQYPQQGNTTGQPSGDISIQDLEREMGIGTNRGGNNYQQQYPQQQYPQQQQPSGSGIPGMEDYPPTNQPNTLPQGQQQLPGCSGGSLPGCSGNLWKMLGIGALLAFLFRRKS